MPGACGPRRRGTTASRLASATSCATAAKRCQRASKLALGRLRFACVQDTRNCRVEACRSNKVCAQHARWQRVLRLNERRTPKHLGLHLIVDTPRTAVPTCRNGWNGPRLTMHFTPTSASWPNMVECFFRDITDGCIRRDSFTSMAELELAIELVRHPSQHRSKADHLDRTRIRHPGQGDAATAG